MLNQKKNNLKKLWLWKKIEFALNEYSLYDEFLEVGKVISVSDGVARVSGLMGVKSGERVKLGDVHVDGVVLSLERNIVGVAILGNEKDLQQDSLVYRTKDIMSIPLTVKLFGRVIDSLSYTIDRGKNLSPLTKVVAKGFYGIKLQTWILRDLFDVIFFPKNNRYDLPWELNLKTFANISVKCFKGSTIGLSDLNLFLSSKNLNLILIKYKLISKLKVKVVFVYYLNRADCERLLKSCNRINKKKLKELKTYFFSLNKVNVSKSERNRYVKLSREIDKKNLLTINCKLDKSNQRIQCSMTLNRLKRFFNNKSGRWSIQQYTNLELNFDDSTKT